LDDSLTDGNPVRAIDVFVDEFDLARQDFGGVEPEATGRPAYHPATLLKIYLDGYLNRVQSSRRLERECQRKHRVGLADRPTNPGLQDHSRLPQGQWRGYPQGLPRVRGAVPTP
jgi:hypothetical protein